MRRPGLRSVVLWPVVATLSVGVTGLGLYVEQSVRSDLIATVDDEVARVLNAGGPGGPPPPLSPNGAPPPGPPPGAPPPPIPPTFDQSGDPGEAAPIRFTIRDDGTVDDRPGVTAIPFDDDQVAELVGTTAVRTLGGAPRFRVGTTLGPDGSTEVAALSLAQVDDSITSLRRNLVVGGFALFVLQALVVWSIVTRIVRPVTRLSAVSTRIAAGELDAPIGAVGGPAETVALAGDLEAMVAQLREMIVENERSAAEATAARDDMQRFLADASHELRTPLTALKGYSDLYERGMLADDEALDRAISRIGSESERMRRLVVDMLQLVRDGTDAEPVDVTDIVGAVIDDLRAAHPDRSISIRSPAESLVVLGDPHRLHQALLNVAANACQHTSTDVPVEVHLGARDDAVVIDVVDHGKGIDPAQAEAIFLPFTRGDGSRSRDVHDGAGLGLAITRRIVSLHHGEIRHEPTAGGGATFIVELPRHHPAT